MNLYACGCVGFDCSINFCVTPFRTCWSHHCICLDYFDLLLFYFSFASIMFEIKIFSHSFIQSGGRVNFIRADWRNFRQFTFPAIPTAFHITGPKIPLALPPDEKRWSRCPLPLSQTGHRLTSGVGNSSVSKDTGSLAIRGP